MFDDDDEYSPSTSSVGLYRRSSVQLLDCHGNFLMKMTPTTTTSCHGKLVMKMKQLTIRNVI